MCNVGVDCFRDCVSIQSELARTLQDTVLDNRTPGQQHTIDAAMALADIWNTLERSWSASKEPGELAPRVLVGVDMSSCKHLPGSRTAQALPKTSIAVTEQLRAFRR